MTAESRRVFVTGMGLVSPTGNQVDAAFDRVFAGDSGVRLRPPDPETGDPAFLVAPAPFESDGEIPPVQARLMARCGAMAILAARDALHASGILEDDEVRRSLGLYVGCALGGAEALEDHYRRYIAGRRPRPASVPLSMASGPAAHLAMHFGILGPALTYSIACVSSAAALGEAFRALRCGVRDRVLAGGTEAQLNGGTLRAWSGMGVLATEHDEGAAASSRPFDAERSGLVLGEGAAFLVLEAGEAMAARGVEPLAEVVGFAMTSDAHTLTEPHRDGQVRAMRGALEEAGVTPDRIGYVNAHATGTPVGDQVEAAAIREVFGGHADGLPVSSTKGVHGHLVGAAGALEALWTIQALRSGRIPPTAHRTRPDPACDLDCVPCEGRTVEGVDYALTNSFAFGGANVSLVLRRPGLS